MGSEEALFLDVSDSFFPGEQSVSSRSLLSERPWLQMLLASTPFRRTRMDSRLWVTWVTVVLPTRTPLLRKGTTSPLRHKDPRLQVPVATLRRQERSTSLLRPTRLLTPSTRTTTTTTATTMLMFVAHTSKQVDPNATSRSIHPTLTCHRITDTRSTLTKHRSSVSRRGRESLFRIKKDARRLLSLDCDSRATHWDARKRGSRHVCS